MVDKMLAQLLEKKAADFTENGGIKERMTAARLGRRQTQNEEIAALKAEVERNKVEVERLKCDLDNYKAEIERLKSENASLQRFLALAKGQPL